MQCGIKSHYIHRRLHCQIDAVCSASLFLFFLATQMLTSLESGTAEVNQQVKNLSLVLNARVKHTISYQEI